MATAWYVKAVSRIGVSIDAPEIRRPAGKPHFGPSELDCQATSWIDDIFKIFLPVIETDPRIEIYVEVGNDPDDWGIMHAWIVRPIVQHRPHHSCLN